MFVEGLSGDLEFLGIYTDLGLVLDLKVGVLNDRGLGGEIIADIGSYVADSLDEARG
jgi:hypothetical protein